MLFLPMRMIKNAATAYVTPVYEEYKEMQLLLMLLLSMQMIKNAATADVPHAYEDDKKHSYC